MTLPISQKVLDAIYVPSKSKNSVSVDAVRQTMTALGRKVENRVDDPDCIADRYIVNEDTHILIKMNSKHIVDVSIIEDINAKDGEPKITPWSDIRLFPQEHMAMDYAIYKAGSRFTKLLDNGHERALIPVPLELLYDHNVPFAGLDAPLVAKLDTDDIRDFAETHSTEDGCGNLTDSEILNEKYSLRDGVEFHYEKGFIDTLRGLGIVFEEDAERKFKTLD